MTNPVALSPKAIGDQAEDLALEYLIKHGYQLYERQFRCPMGECDLIMAHHDTIVFVEVRYKKTTRFCTPEETIDYNKQKKLIRTAEFYLAWYPTMDCQFDVVAISGTQPNLKITWIPDAFGVE